MVAGRGRSLDDATPSHRLDVQRLVDLFLVQKAQFQHDAAQVSTLGHGLLDDLGRLFVTDIGVEGGGYGRRRQGVSSAPLDVGFETADAPVGEQDG